MNNVTENGNDPNNYHRLFPQLNEISSIKEFRIFLPKLTAAAIDQSDALRLLFLAGEAEAWRQWHSAAQLYTFAIVLVFDQKWDDRILVSHANNVLLLSRGREGRLKSLADVALYAFRRTLAALRCEGITGRRANDWITNALHEISGQSESRTRAMHVALQSIAPCHTATEPDLRAHVGQAHSIILRTAWRISNNGISIKRQAPYSGKHHLFWLCVGVSISVVIGWLARDVLRFPLSSEQFKGANWLGAALIVWPFILIMTWVFAFFEAKRTATLNYIHPRHLIAGNEITAGEIMPFSRDWFFHIFQFVWVPFLGIAIALMAQYEEFPESASPIWAVQQPSLDQPLRVLLALGSTSMPHLSNAGSTTENLRTLLSSDLVALAVGAVTAVIFIANQIRIQSKRLRSGVNFYWWDRRVSCSEWIVRLAMIGIDTFLGIFLLFKIAAIALCAYHLASTEQLKIVYFSADGVGGMKFLMDIFQLVSLLVFLFGVFVIASVYLHWNLPEYRKTDAVLFVVYLGLVLLATMPMLLLDGRLQTARENLIMSLPLPSGSLRVEALGETARMLRDINEVRNWSVSAWSWDLLTSPILPLTGQLLFAVAQLLFREAGGNRLSMVRSSTST